MNQNDTGINHHAGINRPHTVQPKRQQATPISYAPLTSKNKRADDNRNAPIVKNIHQNFTTPAKNIHGPYAVKKAPSYKNFNTDQKTINPAPSFKKSTVFHKNNKLLDMKSHKKKDYQTGHLCETLAMIWLMMKGYRPVAKNFVVGRGTGAGEIDLVMTKGRTLVFIEVKKRPTYADGLHAITMDTQMRIVRASAAFLKRYPTFSSYKVRYDAVIFSPWSWPKHLKDAWRVL